MGVEIGQILMSVRARDVHQPQVMEALRRAKYKFPGRQRLCESQNWGFTKLRREKYEELKKEGRLVKDGVNVKVIPSKGDWGQGSCRTCRSPCWVRSDGASSLPRSHSVLLPRIRSIRDGQGRESCPLCVPAKRHCCSLSTPMFLLTQCLARRLPLRTLGRYQ